MTSFHRTATQRSPQGAIYWPTCWRSTGTSIIIENFTRSGPKVPVRWMVWWHWRSLRLFVLPPFRLVNNFSRSRRSLHVDWSWCVKLWWCHCSSGGHMILMSWTRRARVSIRRHHIDKLRRVGNSGQGRSSDRYKLSFVTKILNRDTALSWDRESILT